jgi:arylsulfatase A-like enzyme
MRRFLFSNTHQRSGECFRSTWPVRHADHSFPASLYDTAMNIPLIARYPGVIEQGQVSDWPIGQYDLMPTILDMPGRAGLPAWTSSSTDCC